MAELIGAWQVTTEEISITEVSGRIIANVEVQRDGSLFIGILRAKDDERWRKPRDLAPLLFRNGKFYKLIANTL